jgi:hypothetical protein
MGENSTLRIDLFFVKNQLKIWFRVGWSRGRVSWYLVVCLTKVNFPFLNWNIQTFFDRCANKFWLLKELSLFWCAMVWKLRGKEVLCSSFCLCCKLPDFFRSNGDFPLAHGKHSNFPMHASLRNGSLPKTLKTSLCQFNTHAQLGRESIRVLPIRILSTPNGQDFDTFISRHEIAPFATVVDFWSYFTLCRIFSEAVAASIHNTHATLCKVGQHLLCARFEDVQRIEKSSKSSLEDVQLAYESIGEVKLHRKKLTGFQSCCFSRVLFPLSRIHLRNTILNNLP